jgi:RHS repeat-associated protein
MSRRAFLLSLILFMLASALRADDHPHTARGFAADKAFHVGDIDSVNLFNGNLTLTIPLGGSYPAGGSLSYGLTLVYNSNVWDFQERADDSTGTTYQQGLPQRTHNSGLGWLLTLGRLLAPFTPGNDTERWVYLSPDGGEHVFYPMLHVGDADEPGDAGMLQHVSYTRDGTYMRMRVLAGGDRVVEMPGGQVHRFDPLGALIQIRDRFLDPFTAEPKNYLNITYGTLLWTLTDSQGRAHKIHFQTLTQDNQPIAVIDRVELAAFGGATATYHFSYASATIARACPHNDPTLGANVQVPLLTSVSLPDGSSYQVPVADYLTAVLPASCRSSGKLRGLTLPTLGRLEYTYQDYTLPATNKIHRQFTSGVDERRTLDAAGAPLGTWSYDTSLTGTSGNQELKNTATDPLGHRTERWFLALPGSHEYSLPFTHLAGDGAGRFLSSRTFNAAGTLLRTTFVLYESDQRPAFPQDQQEAMNVNRREKSSRTQYHDDGNRFADLTRSDFDGLGHHRTETTGGNFPAGNVRTTTVAFNPARGTYSIDPVTNQPGAAHSFSMWPSTQPWVLETFESRRTDEAGTTASTIYCFDAGTGFLLRQRTLKDPGTQADDNDVLAVYTPDAAGNVQTERFFGGDTQGIDTVNTCGMSLPAPRYQIDHTYQFGTRATSQHAGANFFSLEQTIDSRTGLPSQSKDVSGLATDYEYDTMGRLTWVKPAAGNNDGWTEYFYTRALSSSSLANVLIRRRNNGSKSAAVQAQSQILFDALGRVWQEKQLLPSGLFNTRETLYDGAGNKASVSELQTGTPAKKTQFLFYDPFGRAATLRPPDGAAHDVTFNYFGTRVVERTVRIATAAGVESAATTIETYDRQGRLASVAEPSGAADALVTTTYSYDVSNRLRQVQTTSGGVTQNRFFTYDNRGFLTSETHPEKGASGNGIVTYSNYDARGHAGRKIDGPSDLTFVYDSAERLTQVRETGGAQRTLKTFTYAAANGNYTDPVTGAGCFDNRKGKITQQSRFNYVTVNGGPITVELREGLTYCGREGRLSRRSLENWVNGGLNESFFLPNVTYNALGDVTSLEYPRCLHAACAAPSPRTVTYSYSQGLLASVGVPGNAGAYASSITYHPNLMVHQVVHGNGLTDTYAIDPNAMRRPGSITATAPGGAVRWATGAYSYDGAGNVKAIGTHTFTYDKVSRLKTATLFLEPTSSTTQRTQTYTYDAFGNLQAIGGSSARNTPTSSATNRLTSGGYDAAGNLTSWNFNTYQYGPFNLMWSYRTDSDEWIYLYTADDERAWSYKTDNTSLWTLRGPDGKVLREYTSGAAWTVSADNIYRDGSLLATETPQGTRHFSLDHLGTPRLHVGGAPKRADVWLGIGSGAIPVPADYDGDGDIDLSLYHNGAWHFFHDDGTYLKGFWTGGVAGDVPVPADYDGDGDADVVIFRGGAWLFFDHATGANTGGVWTGIPGLPLPMDYDGDGRAEFSIYDRGAWHFFHDNGSYLKGFWTGGASGDLPVTGDFDGDGREEPVIFRGGAWLFFDFTTGVHYRSVWTGANGTLLPVPMDYDGDATADLSVYADGAWHFYQDDGTYLKGIWTGGAAGDQPTPGDFNHSGAEEPSIYRNGAWLFFEDVFGSETYHLYYPFGEEATAFNQDTIRAKFTGHERDLGNLGGAGDDLDYMHARHCSPLTGRFLSVDTGQSAKSPKPQSWNRYSYSRNNPITRLDPDGQVDQNFTPLVFPHDPAAQAEFDNKVAVGTLALGAASLGGIGAIEVGAAAKLGADLSAAFSLYGTTRGNAIHSTLNKAFGGGLPRTFPVIDRFLNGVATSAKSLDLAAVRYQSVARLTSELRGFVTKLANFSGDRVGNVVVRGSEINKRVLELVIQRSALTVEQAKAIAAAAQEAQKVGVTIKVIAVQ